MSDELPFIIDHNGQKRYLARLPVTDEHLQMRAGMTSFRTYLRSIGKDLIPRSQWVPIRRRELFGTKFINNQVQSSGCVAASTIQAFMRLCHLMGMDFRVFSWEMLYALINHGQDRGAVITDAIAHMKRGICSQAMLGYPHYFPSDITQAMRDDGAKQPKLLDVFTATSFDDFGTAIQMGGIPVYPICVGSNYEHFVNGVAGVTPGQGNHSVESFGADQVGGKWVFEHGGSWDVNWGPWKNGCCYHSEAAIADAAHSDDGYVMLSASWAADDPNLPPVPVE